MKINHIASGSSGNAILVDDGTSKLLLDAGLSYRKLSREVRLSEVSGILVTHEHGDHSKAVGELARRGYNVCLSRGTAEALGVPKHFNGHILKDLEQVTLGSWAVLPFLVQHDAAEPMGFLFQSKQTKEKGVYIADSAYVNYAFNGVTHWILEANYREDLLENSNYHEALKARVRKNHFSFDNLKRFLETSDLSATEEIWLVHLSDANSNEQQFINEIEQQTGIPVYCR